MAGDAGAGGAAGDAGAGGMAGDAGAGGVGGSVLCAETDCDDGNPCTDDLCDLSDGSCSNPASADGTSCDVSGDPGQCSSGLCLGLCAEADCDDDRECTEDLCGRANGSCGHSTRPNGSDCDFGGLSGRCMSGTCVDGELCGLVDCSDDNDCTDDVCNPANAACTNPDKVDGAFCETDGNPGLCSTGRCRGLCEFVSCDDGNQCTVDTCDPSNGSCPNPDTAEGTPCDYGDLPGKCRLGLCVGLCTGVVCNDHEECTSDACDASDGTCIYSALTDGIWCDVCEAGTCLSWGTPVLIETNSANSALAPHVAVDPSGNAVAVWAEHDGARYNAWSNRYTPSGGWGTPQLIETENVGSALSPLVAVDASGNAVAVWQQDDGTRQNIWSNRYTPSGGWGTPQLIETENLGSATSPRVAVDTSGNAVAVWKQYDGTRQNIWSNRYTPSGGWGTPELIDVENLGDALGPEVAVDASGNAVAAWLQHDGARYRVWSSRYTPSGGWGTPELIETNGVYFVWGVRLAVGASGDAVAVWQQTDGVYRVWSNRYTPSGGWGAPELIEIKFDYGVWAADVAVDPSGNAVVVGERTDLVLNNHDIWSNRYTPSRGWGTPELIETENVGSGQHPQVAIDQSGNAVAVWQQQQRHGDPTSANIWFNRYTPSGGWGTSMPIEENLGSESPDVAIDQSGNAVAVWRQDDGTSVNIWSNRFE